MRALPTRDWLVQAEIFLCWPNCSLQSGNAAKGETLSALHERYLRQFFSRAAQRYSIIEAFPPSHSCLVGVTELCDNADSLKTMDPQPRNVLIEAVNRVKGKQRTYRYA